LVPGTDSSVISQSN